VTVFVFKESLRYSQRITQSRRETCVRRACLASSRCVDLSRLMRLVWLIAGCSSVCRLFFTVMTILNHYERDCCDTDSWVELQPRSPNNFEWYKVPVVILIFSYFYGHSLLTRLALDLYVLNLSEGRAVWKVQIPNCRSHRMRCVVLRCRAHPVWTNLKVTQQELEPLVRNRRRQTW